MKFVYLSLDHLDICIGLTSGLQTAITPCLVVIIDFFKLELVVFAIVAKVMKFSILLIFGVLSHAYGKTIFENKGKVWSCQTKQEQCQFATVAPVYYTQCKNDDTICSGGGGESDPCEGNELDPEAMHFCTAKMADISDLTDAQKPWVLCSKDCSDECKLH